MDVFNKKSGLYVPASGASPVLPTPTFAYLFNEGGGTTTADEESAFEGTITGSNVSLTTFDGQGVVETAGSASSGIVSDDPTVYTVSGTPFSLELHLYLDSYTNTYPEFVGLSKSFNSPYLAGASLTGGYAGFFFGSNGASFQEFRIPDIDISGGWEHFVIVYDGGNPGLAASYKCYRNAVDTAITTCGPFANETSEMTFGGVNGNRMDGKLDLCRLYANKEVSQSEVTALYNSL